MGVAIVLKQAGIPPFDAPTHVSIPLLVIGALCCNVPGILHVVAWRFGTGSPGSPPEPPPPPPSSPEPLSAPSTGGS
jgi:hypothetical protein